MNDRYYLMVKMLKRFDAWHPWVYARCREVEASPDGHCDIWAREHFKSSIITNAGCIQEVLRDPEITIGIFSHTKPIAKGFLAQIQRELRDNQNLKAAFPEIFWENPGEEAPSWSLDNGLIVKRQGNPKEATFEAHGLVDGMPTSKHFKLMVFDDVVTRESVNTPEQIAKTTEAWELADNLGSIGGRKWVAGTRYHFADTYQEVIRRGSLKARIYPATSDGLLSGTPVLFTPSAWKQKIIDQGEATVSCQLLCNPLAGHQRMFDVTDLRVYEMRPETLMVYIMVDPARSVKKDSDNTAMVVLGLDYAGNKYLLDGFNHRMDLQERWRRMHELWEVWRRAAGVQGVRVGYERFGAIADMDYFKERQKLDRVSFEIIELEWPREGPGSKVDRVQRLGPDLRSHRFYIPYPTDPERLTRNQKTMADNGYSYRISKKIKRVDNEGQIYDLTEQMKLQLAFFPIGGKKDIVDAASRIYDLDPTPPAPIDENSLEPEWV